MSASYYLTTVFDNCVPRKLLQCLKALRSKAEVVNIHVDRAVTRALIETNPSMSQQLVKFDNYATPVNLQAVWVCKKN